MTELKFYENIDDNLIKFVVMISRYTDKWVLCVHKQRSTYEFPGGHVEQGETSDMAAQRELFEETGATDFKLNKICYYSVTKDGTTTFGTLYYAEIHKFDRIPEFEIDRIEFCTKLPDNWTYPDIQPHLLNKIREIYGYTV